MTYHLGLITCGVGFVICAARKLNPLYRYINVFTEETFTFAMFPANVFFLPLLSFQFTFNSYSVGDDDYEGYDFSLSGRLSAVRIIFLYRFVQEVSILAL